MTSNGWENAHITIPRTEMAGLHKTLRDHVNKHHDAVRAHVTAMHKEIGQGTRSVKIYRERFNAFENSFLSGRDRIIGSNSWGIQRATTAQLEDTIAKATALRVIESMLDTARRDADKGIHQPTVAEISIHAPKVTNRTATFPVITRYGSEEGTITFKSNVVTWNVPEGNHAVEDAHEAPLGQVFFDALSKIKWTRTSGGYGTGNNEYNRDNSEYGGGGNYISFAYGPIGETAELEQSARNMGMTVAAYKKMMSEAPRTMRSSVGRW